jgi:AraC family transcriptional regulator
MREEYVSRINRVMDYIEKNFDGDLSLEILSEVAHFSKFHFHRIFSAMMDETLNGYIQRLRVEKAASMLISAKKKSVTEVAFDCGFSGSAAFARSFREAFGMTASEWRNGGHIQYSNIRKSNGKEDQQPGKMWKDLEVSFHYIDPHTQTQIWRVKMKGKNDIQVEVKDMPEFLVAYVRHIGPYHEIGPAFEKITKWALARDLFSLPDTRILAVYHDDPKITEEGKLRTSACVTMPQGAEIDGEVGEMTVPGGKFAVGRFEVLPDGFKEAWDTMMGGWLPESGYQPDDRNCYEVYHQTPDRHPQQKFVLDICVPVKPL